MCHWWHLKLKKFLNGGLLMHGPVCSQNTVPTMLLIYTIEPVLKDRPIGHKNVVCQDRWSLVTGSVILKSRSFCRKCMVCQDRWSPMAVVSQDRFHCITIRHTCIYHISQCTISFIPLGQRPKGNLPWKIKLSNTCSNTFVLRFCSCQTST